MQIFLLETPGCWVASGLSYVVTPQELQILLHLYHGLAHNVKLQNIFFLLKQALSYIKITKVLKIVHYIF